MARSGTSTVDRSSPVALGCASIGMLRVSGIIFLGLIVSLSNAYCPCVPLESKTNQAEKQSHAEHAKPSHPGCQGHGKEQTPDQGAPHDCGHCTGTESDTARRPALHGPANILNPTPQPPNS